MKTGEREVPRATVIVPTHNHHLTLPMTVRAVLTQTVQDLELIIVGDGVTPEVREIATALAAGDRRVEFLDLPKGESEGESHRDAVVRKAQSEAVFYLCDDDLLLPRHIENLLPLLADCDLVQSRNGWVDRDGCLWLYPTDLAESEAVQWQLLEPPRNCVSLTGTAHRLDSYLALDVGWTTTPDGEWTDHYMWGKFLVRPGARAATHHEMTALQWPTSAGREQMTQTERATELATWVERLAHADAHEWLQREVARVTSIQLDRTYRDYINAVMEVDRVGRTLALTLGLLEEKGHEHAADLATLEQERLEHAADLATVEQERLEHAADLATLEQERLEHAAARRNEQARRSRGQAKLAALRAEKKSLQSLARKRRVREKALRNELAQLRGSRSWRLTAPLRSGTTLLRRIRRVPIRLRQRRH